MVEPVLENGSVGSVYPRDPPQNDMSLFGSAATDNLEKQRFCVVNHHDRGFERNNNLIYSEGNIPQNHRKTQHFIRGKMPGGSDKNSFVYGANIVPEKTERRTKQQENREGFLYGSSAVQRFEKKIPARLPNNKLMLEERMRDKQDGKHQKLAADADNYLARYYENKAQQQTNIANEKRKDLEMLRNYNPWGKPGGGAPRGYKNNAEVDAHVTKTLKRLKEEGQVRRGGGGGGSPNRTTSGTVVTSLKMDPEIRFQAAQFNKDIEPRLRYKPDVSYGKELDALVQETTNRKKIEKSENLLEEIRQMESYPFTHGLSTRHQKHVSDTKTISEGSSYDPWGKGFGGIPERSENGKIVKNLQGLKHPTMEKPSLVYGVNDTSHKNKSFENTNSRRKETLMKNPNGQAFVRDFSPKEAGYCPWGRPGAGAPLKDEHGHILTNTTGKLAHDNTKGSAQKTQDPVKKKEYLKTLEKQRQEQNVLREEEKQKFKQDDLGVAAWMRQGRVGRPTYDAVTKEIRANPKATSDITREKFEIRTLKNDNSRCYYDDLQEMAEQRHQRRQMERTKEQQLSLNHVATMNSFWGRPGAGAPMSRDPARRHAEELLPTTSVIFR